MTIDAHADKASSQNARQPADTVGQRIQGCLYAAAIQIFGIIPGRLPGDCHRIKHSKTQMKSRVKIFAVERASLSP
jgi:hypothetical protein